MTASPPRVVLDTNVLLDLWVFDDVRARPLRDALESRRIAALRNGPSVDEFTQVIVRECFRLSTERRFDILRHWDRLACDVKQVYAAPIAASDPDDQIFLDLAYSAAADCLVTRDKGLLRLSRRARRDGLLIAEPGAACSAFDAR
jgi:putative PIN family toxin of toxin-antitoxin system